MIQRAAVLIGVEKTGNLPTLQAVRQGVEEMRQWALGQPGMGGRVTICSDAEGRPVTAGDIKTAIKTYVELGTIEQLIVYFAGHGVNNAYHEIWLLSGAPDDPDEAVNVDGSITLARYCGIPHVVLISDACRTAAESIQAQAVDGSLIFSNTGPRSPGGVDVFYAAAVGKPALEVRDLTAKTSAFQAVYTRALVQSLTGAAPDLIEEGAGPLPGHGYVRPWPLADHLQAVVPRNLLLLRVAAEVSQSPDAVITSRPKAWVSAVKQERTKTSPSFSVSPTSAPSPAAAPTLLSASRQILDIALQGQPSAPASSTQPTLERLRGGRLLGETRRQVSAVRDLGHFETDCGFEVQGIGVVAAYSAGGRPERLEGPGGRVRLWDVAKPAAQVLLVFEDGRGALLPAIPEFIAALTYEEGELVNVTYEPSDRTPRWANLRHRLDELRELRGVIASAARLGVFRLARQDDAEALAQGMQALKGVDPTLAVYAAYALDERQGQEQIEGVQKCLRDDLGLSLFDVTLLAQPPQDPPRLMPADVFPAVPLLSQGWALLEAHGIVLPESLRGLRRHVVDSLWTLFDPEGVAVIRGAIEAKEIV